MLGRSRDRNGIILKGTDILKCCTFLLLLASHAGVFRGACLSSLDERRALLKTFAWEAILLQVFRDSDMFHSIGMSELFVNYICYYPVLNRWFVILICSGCWGLWYLSMLCCW